MAESQQGLWEVQDPSGGAQGCDCPVVSWLSTLLLSFADRAELREPLREDWWMWTLDQN